MLKRRWSSSSSLEKRRSVNTLQSKAIPVGHWNEGYLHHRTIGKIVTHKARCSTQRYRSGWVFSTCDNANVQVKSGILREHRSSQETNIDTVFIQPPSSQKKRYANLWGIGLEAWGVMKTRWAALQCTVHMECGNPKTGSLQLFRLCERSQRNSSYP